jgi:DNA polymerase-3 subunit alpha
MRGRDQVIRYVADKYSVSDEEDDMRVAQIVTFGTLQARAAIRDVGRVLGMPFGDVDRVAKLIPEVLGIKLEEALEQSPELRARIDADGQVKKLIQTALKLEGITRHASRHAAGVVISTKPLIETVPLYKDPKSGDVMSQFNMNCVEKVGLIKFDFLGLRTLTTLADAERMVRARVPDFELAAIPLDDETTYALLRRGDTETVFQVESSGMTDLVVKLKPRTFKEVIPLVALYRPGPLGSGMVDDYVSRKNGTTRVEFLLPELEELTAETLGVIVYQDQVLQIAQKLAGYTLGEADLLRRAMGKKKAEEMAQHRERFTSGAEERGIDGRKAAQVFDLIVEFAGYGFPKAHSTAYALITYQTAYMKANYPAEYLAAVLTIESANHDKLSRYIAHCREKEIEILPPDVNESERNFAVANGAIRFGFAGIKNVGEGAIEAIIEARSTKEGGFASLHDFAESVEGRRVNRRVVEALVKCGAFDSLHEQRSAVWGSLDAALESGAATQRDRAIGQGSLFGGAGDVDAAAAPTLVDVPAWTERERLSYEKELLGFYVTGHPLGSVARELAHYTDVTSTTSVGKDRRDIRAGGLLGTLREMRTRRGQRMAFGTLEDLEGSFELVIFADSYESHGELLRRARDSADGEDGPLPLVVAGTLEAGDTPKILVRDVFLLSEAERRLTSQICVRVLEPDVSRDRMAAFKRVLLQHPGDCAVKLHITIPGESETVLSVGSIRGVIPSDELRRDLDALFGRPVTDLSL